LAKYVRVLAYIGISSIFLSLNFEAGSPWCGLYSLAAVMSGKVLSVELMECQRLNDLRISSINVGGQVID